MAIAVGCELGDDVRGGVGVGRSSTRSALEPPVTGSHSSGRRESRVELLGGDGGGDDLAADEPLELGGRAACGDPTVVEHDDVVGEPVGLLEVLGGEHDGRAGGGELADDVPQRGPGDRVESGGRFVEEQHRRCSRPGWRRGRCGVATRPTARRRGGRRSSPRSSRSISSSARRRAARRARRASR